MLSWLSNAVSYISRGIVAIFKVFQFTSDQSKRPRASSEMVCVGSSKTNKVVIVGDRAVGKSTFMNYLRNNVCNTPIQTIGYDFWIDKNYLNPYAKLFVFYWDSGIGRTDGTNDISSSPYGTMLDNDFFILIYDATWNSFVTEKYVHAWLEILCRRKNTKVIIVGLRRRDQAQKQIHGFSQPKHSPQYKNVITSCICDISVPEQASRVINYIKIICKNECFEMNY